MDYINERKEVVLTGAYTSWNVKNVKPPLHKFLYAQPWVFWTKYLSIFCSLAILLGKTKHIRFPVILLVLECSSWDTEKLKFWRNYKPVFDFEVRFKEYQVVVDQVYE